MESIPSIIETVDWEMNKQDLRNAFSYMDELLSHPTQNAIGFATKIFNIPSAVTCYFYKERRKERLCAVNIMMYEDPPPAMELRKTYSKMLENIKMSYGKPLFESSALTTWVLRGKVLQLNSTTGIIGARFGDPKIDPPSAISIGRKGDARRTEFDVYEVTDENMEEFARKLGSFIIEKIKQNVNEIYRSLLVYRPRNKKKIERELFSFEYFIWDYILHTLCSKSRSENRMQEGEMFDKLRNEIVANIVSNCSCAIEMESVSESCDAYRTSLSRGAQGDNLMKLGFEFGRRSGNPDPALCMIVSGHFSNMWKYIPSILEKQISGYLKS